MVPLKVSYLGDCFPTVGEKTRSKGLLVFVDITTNVKVNTCFYGLKGINICQSLHPLSLVYLITRLGEPIQSGPWSCKTGLEQGYSCHRLPRVRRSYLCLFGHASAER